MFRTSEWVSLGHPDKMADYISCWLLDRYLERDPGTRYAVEVQIKDHFVTLAGEVSSTVRFTDREITRFVKDAVEDIGYTTRYQRIWGKENTICAKDLKVTVHIGQQSPDIACGVQRGWGDQGIFWGMAQKGTSSKMPKDHLIARKLGEALFNAGLDLNIGLDIKTQVSMEDDRLVKVIVAAPLVEDTRFWRQQVLSFIQAQLGEAGKHIPIILNGTGSYTIHGPRGDAGTTGRKLAVDFYGGNCRLGGGCPWTKDASKADLTLNLYARKLALRKLSDAGIGTVFCSIECCIGQPDITICYFDESMRQIGQTREHRPPEDIIAEMWLRKPRYAERCRKGLFFDIY